MDQFYTAAQWLRHRLLCESPHSVHSPALYQFYIEVIRKDFQSTGAELIEIQRKGFKLQPAEIPWIEMGSGSSPVNGKRKIRDIALRSLTPAQWCRLLYRLANYLNAKHTLELGTCLGISALYLSEKSDSLVTTLEGNSALIPVAEAAIQKMDRSNIRIIPGNIDENLDEILQSLPAIDLVFMDANHQYIPTVSYAKKIWSQLRPGSILIADDIYRSEAMTRAWKTIQNFESCACTIDLFRWGLAVQGPSKLSGHHKWTIS